ALIKPSDSKITIDGHEYSVWKDAEGRPSLTRIVPTVATVHDEVVDLEGGVRYGVKRSGNDYIFTRGAFIAASSSGTVTLENGLQYQIRSLAQGNVSLVRAAEITRQILAEASQAVQLGSVRYELRREADGSITFLRENAVAGKMAANASEINLDGTAYRVSAAHPIRPLVRLDAKSQPVEMIGAQAVIVNGKYYSVNYDEKLDRYSFNDGIYSFVSEAKNSFSGKKLVTLGGVTYEVRHADYGNQIILSQLHGTSHTEVLARTLIAGGVNYSYWYDGYANEFWFDNGYGAVSSDAVTNTVILSGRAYQIRRDPFTDEISLLQEKDFATSGGKITLAGTTYTIEKRGVNTYRLKDGAGNEFVSNADQTVTIAGMDYRIEEVDRNQLNLIFHERGDYTVENASVIIGPKTWAVTANAAGGYDFRSGQQLFQSVSNKVIYLEGVRFDLALNADGKVTLSKAFESLPSPSAIEIGGKVYLVTWDVMRGVVVFRDGMRKFDSNAGMTQVTLPDVKGQDVTYDLILDPAINQISLNEPHVSVEKADSTANTVTLDGKEYSISRENGKVIFSRADARFELNNGILVLDDKKYSVVTDAVNISVLHFERIYTSSVVKGQVLRIFGRFYALEGRGDGQVNDQDKDLLAAAQLDLTRYDLNGDGKLDDRDLDVKRGEIASLLDAIRKADGDERKLQDFINAFYSQERISKETLAAADQDHDFKIDTADVNLFISRLADYLDLDVELVDKPVSLSARQTLVVDGASYQVERKADGSLIFKSTDLSWTSNTQATEVKIGAIIYQIQINTVTGEYQLIASETVQTSEPFVILNGLKYSIANYDGSRFEIVRGPDHYIQKTDGTVEIAGAIYNLSFDAAAGRWSFVRAIDIHSSLPAVELGGINYRIEQPAAGDYALVTPDGIRIAFDKNKSIFEIGHVIYDVITNAVTAQVTFTRRSLFNAAGNSIHLLGKDFSVQQNGDGTFTLTSGSLSYTSYKPSANQHRLRIGYFSYDV
ncbi:MAG: hypothetical protein HYZ83_01240, partial [Candidatus Omnitrophica bacterium]|nr:hypothetical protein [Candidatus Omnitrophota bacterium]